jgi:hypothetical protein
MTDKRTELDKTASKLEATARRLFDEGDYKNAGSFWAASQLAATLAREESQRHTEEWLSGARRDALAAIKACDSKRKEN